MTSSPRMLHVSFVTFTPRCFPFSTHGNSFPHNFSFLNGLLLFRNAKHFVLDLFGFVSVLNFRLCSPALLLGYFKHVLKSINRWSKEEQIICVPENTNLVAS